VRVAPDVKRAIVFVDGQNLFHAAREAFGYNYPNYDVSKLAGVLCAAREWALAEVRFYTGIPAASDKPFWHHFWMRKLAAFGRRGVVVFSRSLRYRKRTIKLPDGSSYTLLVGEEKGIDVRIALDVISLAHKRTYDVALILSQDQDLSEVAKEIRTIAREQDRWIKIASAYPLGPTSRNRRGINETDWLPIEQALYDRCIDSRDYRPRRGRR